MNLEISGAGTFSKDEWGELTEITVIMYRSEAFLDIKVQPEKAESKEDLSPDIILYNFWLWRVSVLEFKLKVLCLHKKSGRRIYSLERQRSGNEQYEKWQLCIFNYKGYTVKYTRVCGFISGFCIW